VIPWQLIMIAAVVTGAAVPGAAARGGWPPPELVAASILSAALVAGWRALANLYGLNEDFGPLVSVGDAGGLVAGSLGPLMVVAMRRVPTSWTPAIVGGLVGFVVNVVIL
jgi:hypothetical protein